ncbi:hypothetical protein JZ751_008689 [Albula glossodonta]|uniref:Uncharacterized protein n=1 Tax=Albula glossodonta TaxID=121402 RepID=A0A8T2NYW7_9TELE|nr:hypothetical protein JZ751_008689 [Albula glossodonta]
MSMLTNPRALICQVISKLAEAIRLAVCSLLSARLRIEEVKQAELRYSRVMLMLPRMSSGHATVQHPVKKDCEIWSERREGSPLSRPCASVNPGNGSLHHGIHSPLSRHKAPSQASLGSCSPPHEDGSSMMQS